MVAQRSLEALRRQAKQRPELTARRQVGLLQVVVGRHLPPNALTFERAGDEERRLGRAAPGGRMGVPPYRWVRAAGERPGRSRREGELARPREVGRLGEMAAALGAMAEWCAVGDDEKEWEKGMSTRDAVVIVPSSKPTMRSASRSCGGRGGGDVESAAGRGGGAARSP